MQMSSDAQSLRTSEMLRVENLSKLYRLGEFGSGTLKEDLMRFWVRLLGKPDPYQQIATSNVRDEYFQKNFLWALKDINFSINQGDTLGLIGRNGAGKSTLLRIIARITYPTHGKIYLNGRVASLLEVGTGFHDALSGRDNIYISGSILGMGRKQIQKQYENIVEFSGIRKFIDTPIRRYSVGMRLRLAFAVSAHLDADILLLDEVLAVGDYAFRNKAIEHIRTLANSNRTIIYVAHQLSTVRRLCNKGILFENGSLRLSGTVQDILDAYVSEPIHGGTYSFPLPVQLPHSLGYITTLELLDSKEEVCEQPLFTEGWKIKVNFKLYAPIQHFAFVLQIALPDGRLINTTRVAAAHLENGYYTVLLQAQPNQLGAGAYLLTLQLIAGADSFDTIKDKVVIHLADDKENDPLMLDPKALMPNPLRADLFGTQVPK